MLPAGLSHVCVTAGQALLNAVLPPLCLGCGEIVEAPGALCAGCWQGFSFIAPPHCAGCLARAPKFRRARAALAYDASSRRLVLPFKHGDRTDIARAGGDWMARAGADLLADADLVVPVPLHWRRLLARRYNQALLLARAVLRAAPQAARRGGAIRLAPDLLRRRKWTGSQAGLRAGERHRNVRQAFDIHPRWADEVVGRTVLLVDDVFTTGATVEACARVLQRGGAHHVDVLTLARVVRPAL